MSADTRLLNTKEKVRLDALSACGLMHSLPETEYDAITRLAARLCRTPVSYISLVNEEEQWIKSGFGIERGSMPRSLSFCQYTIASTAPYFEIKDTLLDERFVHSPFVTNPPHYRYYAGFALTDEAGNRLGSLCVLDVVPRILDKESIDSMLLLAGQVMSLIDLRKQKARLQEYSQLFNRSNEIHAILGTDARILKVNDAAQALLGHPREKLLGRSIWSLFSRTDRAPLRRKVSREIKGGNKFFGIEARMAGHNGGLIWISWSADFIGQKWYVSGRDVSYQKKLLGELKEMSLVGSHIKNGVVVSSREGAILWVNRAFEKLTGYALQDISGKRLSEVICGEHTDTETIEKAREFVRKKQSFEIDLLAYRKDGSPMWLSVINSMVTGNDGETEKQIEILVDITARQKASEEILRAKEEALQLSRAKDLFISVMSHEIRTPLNAVIGIAHLLAEEGLNGQQEENVKLLQFSAQNLMRLINDVLDLTKIETGNLELEKADVDLRGLVEGIILTQQHKANEKKIYLRSVVDSRIPAFIKADQTRLYQILMNLVGNAIKFTPAGGVTLRVSNRQEDDHKISLLFEVIDTGIGIDPSKKETIFEVFRQAEADTTRNYGGTGLGLPITKKLVELHRSSITVESEPGKGSAFSFAITFRKSLPQQSQTPGTGQLPLAMDVLVVDDNQINRMLVGKVLNRWGVKTDFAENGIDALAKIEEKKYDAVLMDINMPKMGGLEATRIIRQRNAGHFEDLPVLALTASVMQNELSEMSNAGMNDYVLKPFEPELLLEKLRKYA